MRTKIAKRTLVSGLAAENIRMTKFIDFALTALEWIWIAILLFMLVYGAIWIVYAIFC